MKLKKNEYYKCTRPDLTSFHDSKTRWDEGSVVELPVVGNPRLCSKDVLHASRKPFDALRYGDIPCAMSVVRGKPVVEDSGKSGFFCLEVVRNIPPSEYDELFGFCYSEAVNPVNPCDIDIGTVSVQDKKMLRQWTSVGNSVWASVGDSIMDSVRASVWDSVLYSVWYSVRASVRDSVLYSVWASVWDSVLYSVEDSIRDSVQVYIGSLFPHIKRWKYAPKSDGYPYASAVRLWKRGFIPVLVGEQWRLYHPVRGEPAVLMYEEAK